MRLQNSSNISLLMKQLRLCPLQWTLHKSRYYNEGLYFKIKEYCDVNTDKHIPLVV